MRRASATALRSRHRRRRCHTSRPARPGGAGAAGPYPTGCAIGALVVAPGLALRRRAAAALRRRRAPQRACCRSAPARRRRAATEFLLGVPLPRVPGQLPLRHPARADVTGGSQRPLPLGDTDRAGWPHPVRYRDAGAPAVVARPRRAGGRRAMGRWDRRERWPCSTPAPWKRALRVAPNLSAALTAYVSDAATRHLPILEPLADTAVPVRARTSLRPGVTACSTRYRVCPAGPDAACALRRFRGWFGTVGTVGVSRCGGQVAASSPPGG